MENIKIIKTLMAKEVKRHDLAMESLREKLAQAEYGNDKADSKSQKKTVKIKGAWRAWLNGDKSAVVPDLCTATDCIVIMDWSKLTAKMIRDLRRTAVIK